MERVFVLMELTSQQGKTGDKQIMCQEMVCTVGKRQQSQGDGGGAGVVLDQDAGKGGGRPNPAQLLWQVWGMRSNPGQA